MTVKANNDQNDTELAALLAKHRGGDAAAKQKLQQELLDRAAGAATHSYSPYSKFPVGVALLSKDGRVFTGCNVENASYGATICAERTALVKAISEGCCEFEMLAVVCTKVKDAWPCGICRQFISEFGGGIEIVSESQDGSVQVLRIADLLPNMFGPGALGL